MGNTCEIAIDYPVAMVEARRTAAPILRKVCVIVRSRFTQPLGVRSGWTIFKSYPIFTAGKRIARL